MVSFPLYPTAVRRDLSLPGSSPASRVHLLSQGSCPRLNSGAKRSVSLSVICESLVIHEAVEGVTG